MLVDIFCDDVIFAAQQGAEMRTIFKAAISKYTVNESRMLRYADRRGKKEVFKNYIVKHKSVFYDLSIEKRMDYIENTIQKDMKLRNSMKGMIIGHFTVEEYLIYIENSSALNKRMMRIVKERLLSHIQLFERPELLAAV